MTAAELIRAGERLYGPKWKAPLARALGVDASTLWRYLQEDRIPGPVAAAVSCWLLTRERSPRKFPNMKPHS